MKRDHQMRDWNFLARTASQDRERSRSPVKAEESPKMPFPLPPSLTITAKHKEIPSPGQEKEAKSNPDSTSYPSDKLQQVIIWHLLSKLVSNCTRIIRVQQLQECLPCCSRCWQTTRWWAPPCSRWWPRGWPPSPPQLTSSSRRTLSSCWPSCRVCSWWTPARPGTSTRAARWELANSAFILSQVYLNAVRLGVHMAVCDVASV